MTSTAPAPPRGEGAGSRPLRIAVVGHVEHVTVGRVAAVPRAGDIVHLDTRAWLPGGGGGIAFAQLARGPAEVHLLTALGDDPGSEEVERALRARGATVHVARRRGAQNRSVVLVTPDAERTIIVIGAPLHVRRDDPLPWDLLSRCDAVYFTSDDPGVLVAARAARLLVVTARRRQALVASGVRADVVVGSRADPREASTLADYPVRPGALVLTEGSAGGTVATGEGPAARFPAPARPADASDGGAYGAGDSFAGALTFYLAAGLPLLDACARAGRHGAAVLAGLDPLASQLPLSAPGGDAG